jgi:hypothetical protein
MQHSSNVALIPNAYGLAGNGGFLVTSGFPFGYSPTFTNLDPASIRDAATDPIAAGGYDTIVLVQIDYIQNWLSNATFKSRVENFISNGGKLIVYDSECTHNDYSLFIYPFTANTPGALGSPNGQLWIVENNTLSTNDTSSSAYVNTTSISGGWDIGDANVMTTLNGNSWYVDMVCKNTYGTVGPVQTYANYSKGLIVWNGLDMDYFGYSSTVANDNYGADNLNYIWFLQLYQQFNPDNLTGGVSVAGITLLPHTATNYLGTTHTVTATVTDNLTQPISGATITFTIVSGPNSGTTGTGVTNSSGQTNFSWTSLISGTDTVNATTTSSLNQTIFATATKTWIPNVTHDVAVTNVTALKTVAGLGYLAPINVTVANLGGYTETFNTTLYVENQTTISQTAINQTGLVGYWKFDEGSGTTVYDSSLSGNDGTVYGATWINGRLEKALRFDGNDYVLIPNTTAQNFESGVFTLEAWARFANDNHDNVIIGKHQSGYSNGYFIGIRNNRFDFLLGNTQSLDRIETSETYNDGQWHHVVGVYSRPNQYLYVDGTLKAQESINYSVFNSLDINMGRVFNAGYLNGDVDEAKIYNRALSAEEVRQEYEGVTNLVGYWKFDEGNGTTAYDSSGNGNNGTLVNGPTWVDGKSGKALSFDGIDDYLDAGNGPSLQFGNNFTLEAWIKPNNMVGETLLISKYGSNPPGGFYFETGAHALLLLAYFNGTDWTYAGSSVSTMKLNRWNHIVVTMNDTKTSYYINGLLTGTADNVQMTPNAVNDLNISSASFPFNGTIDEVKIFNRALSAEEVWAEFARALIAVGTQTVTLGSGASKTLNFTWNTTDFACGNYTATAYAWPVSGETSTSDNTFTDGMILVTIPGDINGDFKCALADLSLLAKAFNTYPGDAKWNPNADINGNGNVGLSDLSIMAKHFNQHCPQHCP